MTSVKFQEIQRFSQIWLWLLVLITGLPSYYAMFREPLGLSYFDIAPGFQKFLLVFFVLHSLIVVLLLIVRLKVEISGRFLTYQFFPFHLKKKKYPLNQIHSAFIREFNPLKEQSAVGIKFGNKTKPYNIKGKWGLHIEFNNGRQLLLGTQKPEELDKVLKELHISEE
jgi:hypothetical protein